jgi:hypothetical protein
VVNELRLLVAYHVVAMYGTDECDQVRLACIPVALHVHQISSVRLPSKLETNVSYRTSERDARRSLGVLLQVEERKGCRESKFRENEKSAMYIVQSILAALATERTGQG